MKVIVVFNRLRQLFTNVEEMNFADFKEAVAAAFGLSSQLVSQQFYFSPKLFRLVISTFSSAKTW